MKRYLCQLTFALTFFLCLLFPRISEGAPGNDNPTGVTGDYNGSITTGGSYDPYTGNAKRFVTDLTVTGSVGAYPLKWTRVLNTRNGQMNAPFGQGGTWRHSYQWGLWVRPYGYHYAGGTYDGIDGSVSYPDGRKMDLLANPDGSYVQASLGFEPLDRLETMGGGNFDLVLKDGGRVKFQRPPGSSPAGHDVIATAIVDPYGQTTLLGYDGLGHLSTITEPAGRYLRITYQTYSYHVNWPSSDHHVDVISKVEAFAGPGSTVPTETVIYTYLPEQAGQLWYYNLARVDYDDHTHADYTYLPSTAGAGSSAVSGRIHTCGDVRYAGAMSKIEYEYQECVGLCDVAVGQIKREKNLTNHQVVSEVIYPGYNPYSNDTSQYVRTEARPDGATRIFQYSNDGQAELQSYTDFEGHPTWISGFVQAPAPANYLRIVTDARGYTTTTERTWRDGAVMSVQHDNDPAVIYAYSDPSNPWYLRSRTDELQHTTWYDRYPVGGPNPNMIQQIRYPDGGFETFTYNNFGQVLEHVMTSGGKEVSTYDTRGLKTTSYPPPTLSDLSPWSHPTLYYYYTSGPQIDRLQYTVDPRGNATWFEYNGRGQVTKLTHQDGTSIQNQYNDDGTLAWTADENHPNAGLDGHDYERTRYTYDEYKRVVTVTPTSDPSNPSDPLQKTTTNSYAPWNMPNDPLGLSHTTSSIYLTTLPSGKQIKHDYDNNFRLKSTTVAPGIAGEEATTSFTYDHVGNQDTMTEPNHLADQKHTTYGYDHRNRLETVTDAFNQPTTTKYDYAGNKISIERADHHLIQFTEYDEMNRLKKQIDERNFPSSMTYDYAGNLKKH